MLLVTNVTVKGPVSGRDVVVVLVKSVTVNGAVSGKDVVVARPVANGSNDVVLEKPTGDPKLELVDGIVEMAVEVTVGT